MTAVKLGSSINELVAAIQAGQLQTVEALLSHSLPVRDYIDDISPCDRSAAREPGDFGRNVSTCCLHGYSRRSVILDAALALRPVIQKLLQLGVPVSADSQALQKYIFAEFNDISLDLLSASRGRGLLCTTRIQSHFGKSIKCHVRARQGADQSVIGMLHSLLASGYVSAATQLTTHIVLCCEGLRSICSNSSKLLYRASLGQLGDSGLSALKIAASHQDAQVLQILIRSGADVDLNIS